jgi:hypothetical protein
VAEIVVLTVWAVWLTFSLLVYVPPLTMRIRRWDLLVLVPEWKFFSHPPQENYFLLYRDIAGDGSVTGWKEIGVARRRAWWNFFWNPGRRARKAFFDLVVETARKAHYGQRLEGTIPYLTLLNYISSLPRSIPAARTQFAIFLSAAAGPEREPRMMVASAIHEL